MKLTTQMQAEIGTIRTRVDHIIDQVWVPMESGLMRRDGECLVKNEDIAHATAAELNPYKVRLENILCETDVKEQAHSHKVRRRIIELSILFYLYKGACS